MIKYKHIIVKGIEEYIPYILITIKILIFQLVYFFYIRKNLTPSTKMQSINEGV